MSNANVGESPRTFQADSANNRIIFDSNAARRLRGALVDEGTDLAKQQTPLGELCRLLGFSSSETGFPDDGFPDPPAFEVQFVGASGSVADLEAAIAEAAKHPEGAADLANALGVGKGRPKGETDPEEAFLFDWHTNESHAALRRLHDHEPGHRQEIVDIAAELQTSNLFWHLLSRYEDAHDAAKRSKDEERVYQVEMAMFARMFAAGTLRRTHVFQDVAELHSDL